MARITSVRHLCTIREYQVEFTFGEARQGKCNVMFRIGADGEETHEIGAISPPRLSRIILTRERPTILAAAREVMERDDREGGDRPGIQFTIEPLAEGSSCIGRNGIYNIGGLSVMLVGHTVYFDPISKAKKLALNAGFHIGEEDMDRLVGQWTQWKVQQAIAREITEGKGQGGDADCRQQEASP